MQGATFVGRALKSQKDTAPRLCAEPRLMGLAAVERMVIEFTKAAFQRFISGRSLPSCPACPSFTCGEVHIPPLR